MFTVEIRVSGNLWLVGPSFDSRDAAIVFSATFMFTRIQES